MAWYRVPIITTAVGHVDVEANSPESAAALALDLLPRPLCAHCSGRQSDWERDEAAWDIDPEHPITEL